MNARIVEFGGVEVVGIKDLTTIKNAKMDCPVVWDRFLESGKNIIKGDSYGISVTVDATSGEFEYIVGIPKSDFHNEFISEVEFKIPSGEYLRIEHNQPADICKIYYDYYTDWEKTQTDYSIDYTRFSFEEYTSAYRVDCSYSINIPVKKVNS